MGFKQLCSKSNGDQKKCVMKRLTDSFIFKHSINSIKLIPFRKLVSICTDHEFKQINNSTNEILQILYNKISQVDDYNASDPYPAEEHKMHLYWLWLWRELQFIGYDVNNESLVINLQDILNKIIHLNSEKNIINELINISVRIVDVLMVEIGVKFIDNDKIKNFNKYLEFIAETLRVYDYSLCGWMLLTKEIENFDNYKKQYKYYDILVKFLNDKAVLFKKNIVESNDILNKKYNGDVNDAEIKLNISTKICWTINKMIENNEIDLNEMVEFAGLYSKMKKTKLIKPIIQKLNLQ